MKEKFPWYIGGFILVVLLISVINVVVAAALAGLIPIVLIFFCLTVWELHVGKFKKRSFSDVVKISIGWGAAIGLILLIWMVFRGL